MSASIRSHACLQPEKSHLELKEEFCAVDRDADGRIDSSEFAKFMRSLNRQSDDARVSFEFGAIDSDRDGRIAFPEFLTWWRAQ